jgi:hypothetical protein
MCPSPNHFLICKHGRQTHQSHQSHSHAQVPSRSPPSARRRHLDLPQRFLHCAARAAGVTPAEENRTRVLRCVMLRCK